VAGVRLLVVHHTPSPTMATMLERVLDGARVEDLVSDDGEQVEVIVVPALSASASDVLAADGYLLGTPANLGYMSGALKHFFDQIYYPCLDATAGRPFGLYVHGNNDVDGAVLGVERILTGLRWRQAADHVRVTGDLSAMDRDACWELGATLAAQTLGLT